MNSTTGPDVTDARTSLLSPQLDSLRADLESVGLVVVPFRDEVHVRLSTLEHVRVRINNGRLECEPWVGMVPRTRAMWTLVFLVALGIPASLIGSGITSESLAAALLVLGAALVAGLRHLLVDGCITRIQMVWLMARRDREN